MFEIDATVDGEWLHAGNLACDRPALGRPRPVLSPSLTFPEALIAYGRGVSVWITKDNVDVVVAWATLAGVAVGALGVLAAIRQLVLIRRDSHDRTRPYVQLDVVPGLQGPGSWDLVIENRGASTALQVVVDPGVIHPLDRDDHISPVVGDYLETPKSLVPGARRRVMWGYDSGGVKAGVLEPRHVTVTYVDERLAARRWRTKPYRETLLVGEALGPAAFPAPFEGPKPTSQDMLAHIDRAIRTLNTHVGELRR
ncbi:hypothetical protein [Phycicoccus avicenniae]|uniref:hypothetical protein n=1 Tax=Phycicoccus avicenniae TaxID=2828860 RepID=UPI003D273A42